MRSGAAFRPFRRARTRLDPTVAARTRAGDVLWLPRVGGAVSLRRASGGGRPYWRDIIPSLCGNDEITEKRLNLMRLVLAAKRVPYVTIASTRRPALLVPVTCERVARHEIAAFEAERLRRQAVPAERTAGGQAAILFFFLALILWHGLRMQWFAFHLPAPFPADPAAWPSAFGLDVYRTRVLGEWWRTLTALFLHTDAEHLFSNVGFGLIFFWALTRRIGSAAGFAFAGMAGVLGNACNALYKPAFILTIGFSTALFGAVGVLSGVCVCDAMKKTLDGKDFRRLLVPVAAGLAFLAMFGGGGEIRTDYAAHIFGFCVGFFLGGPAHFVDARMRRLKAQGQAMVSRLLGIGSVLVVVAGWACAVTKL